MGAAVPEHPVDMLLSVVTTGFTSAKSHGGSSAVGRDFLEPPQDMMITRLAAVSALLRSELAGANVDAMISEDPQLLTQDPASISKGSKPCRG